MTALYSILHFLVDGVCALAMFGTFAARENWYVNILLYNFCAFALQMPLGVVLDGLCVKRSTGKALPPYLFAVAGVMLTLAGAFIHPVVLGLGNALFHLGGGVATIQEDTAKGRRGRGLGVFVAPGALGLYIGTLIGKSETTSVWGVIIPIGVVMVLCLLFGRKCLLKTVIVDGKVTEHLLPSDKENLTPATRGLKDVQTVQNGRLSALWLAAGCLFVVILRSYIGMAVSFSWKTTVLAGILAVCAVVFGKVAGGFAAAAFGIRRTMAISLGAAAVGYLLSGNMAAGIMALFLFNMTMPITLYLLICRLKELPGFAFGLLTFGIFLGLMPVYLEMVPPMDSKLVGCLGSVISLVILWFCAGGVKPVKTFAQVPSDEEEGGAG